MIGSASLLWVIGSRLGTRGATESAVILAQNRDLLLCAVFLQLLFRRRTPDNRPTGLIGHQADVGLLAVHTTPVVMHRHSDDLIGERLGLDAPGYGDGSPQVRRVPDLARLRRRTGHSLDKHHAR